MNFTDNIMKSGKMNLESPIQVGIEVKPGRAIIIFS